MKSFHPVQRFPQVHWPVENVFRFISLPGFEDEGATRKVAEETNPGRPRIAAIYVRTDGEIAILAGRIFGPLPEWVRF